MEMDSPEKSEILLHQNVWKFDLIWETFNNMLTN